MQFKLQSNGDRNCAPIALHNLFLVCGKNPPVDIENKVRCNMKIGTIPIHSWAYLYKKFKISSQGAFSRNPIYSETQENIRDLDRFRKYFNSKKHIIVIDAFSSYRGHAFIVSNKTAINNPINKITQYRTSRFFIKDLFQIYDVIYYNVVRKE